MLGVMETTTEQTLLARLNKKYSQAEGTRLANEGKWAEAAESFGKYGMGGLWAQCIAVAGQPHGHADWIASRKK
jgi:hypothetical protein